MNASDSSGIGNLSGGRFTATAASGVSGRGASLLPNSLASTGDILKGGVRRGPSGEDMKQWEIADITMHKND